MVVLTWINEEDVVVWDYFNANWEDDCWQKNIDKLPFASNPCPTGNNFYVSNTKSSLVPMWCQDWTRYVFFSDANLQASNIKQWVTIFWVTWTRNWQAYTAWNNITLSWAVLSYSMPDWLYSWGQTISITPSGVLPQYIKHWVTIFWVTWTFYWTDNPSWVADNWYHTWVTFTAWWLTWWFWAPYGNTINLQQKVAYVYWAQMYFLVSAFATWWSTWYWYNTVSIVRYDWTTLQECWNKQIDWWTHLWRRYFFTTSPNWAQYIRIVEDERVWSWNTYHLWYQLNMTNWTVSAFVWDAANPNWALISQTSVFNGWRYYEPMLVPSERILFSWTLNEIPSQVSGSYALNIKVTV